MKKIHLALILQLLISGCDAQSAFSSKTNQNKISYQKALNSFYKTDSIFPFRSSKGYVPSLLHNMSEPATAPFQFKTKHRIVFMIMDIEKK